MVASMTAFARHEQQSEWGTIFWELRSINHRYLETQFRLPENLRDLEPALRELLRNGLFRGKIETNLQFRPNLDDPSGLKLNAPLLAQLNATLEQVRVSMGAAGAVNPLDLLRWPGVVEAAEVDYEKLKELALAGFEAALKQLSDMRRQEGRALAGFIGQRLENLSSIVTALRARLPQINAQYRDKLYNRIKEAQIEVDSGRLEQELALLLQKIDVDEELDRLQTHVAEVKRSLLEKGAIGRKLDFIMQELNREANTLSSKSVDQETTQAAVELKVLIEQMREQVQNIE